MSRTPLLRGLTLLAREHYLAREVGSSPDAIRAKLHERRPDSSTSAMTRRAFLQSMGLVGAGVALGPILPVRNVSAAQPARVAIVGGGIAGLAAALTLADAGVASTLYEASGRLGGRMHSLPAYWADGQVSEWCGEFIDSEHRTIRNLCRRFGLPLDDLLAAQPSTSQDTYFFAGSYYRNLDQDFEPVYRALQCDLEDAGETTTYRESTPAAIELDDMSLHDWIETRVPGGHGSALGQLLDVAYTVEFGADTADQSALNVVYQLGSGAMPGDFHMYGESDERFHIRGGNESLPNAIAAALSEEAIMRGWRMIALEQGAAGTLELTFDTAIGEQRIAADVVILALPFAVLRTLDYGRAGFDELKQQAVQELGAGRNGKLLVQLASRYWNTAGPWGISTGTTYSDREYQSSWDVSRAQPGMGGLLGDYLGGTGITSLEAAQQAPYSTDDDPRTASLATRFLAQLEDVYPGISPYANGKAVLSLPHLDPNLRLSYSYYRVGQYHAFGGYERAPQGNVYFAGEHCSRDFQGFMEGAAREGIRAANGILSKLGLAYTAEEDATAAQR